MDKYILITGASSGIGAACARRFAKEGYHLVLMARRMDRLETIKNELAKFPVKVLLFNVDVREESQVRKAVASFSDEVKSKLSILINNAGLAVGKGPLSDGLLEDWNRMIDTNIKGLLHISKEIIPILKTNKKGHIFNLSSIAGKEVYMDGNVYCASKHAVDALSKSMRMELVSHSIRVTNIAPGAIETEFSLVRFKGDDQVAAAVYDGFTPLSADDVADTIYYAASLPPHVNLNDITIMPSAQASATVLNKNLV
jgi:NADP-dependent 3-hydroxy acid dehydrogenase YdfG